jgi:hypothetical protein
MNSPTWIYHRELEAKLIQANELQDYLAEGWSDTPATFLNEEINDERQENNTTEEKPTRKGRQKRVLGNDNS